VILGSVAAIAVTCGALLASSRWQQTNDRRDARAAVILYLQLVRRGDYHGAYGQLCVDETREVSEQDYTQYMRGQPTFSAFSVGDATDEVSGLDGTYFTVAVQVTRSDGTITATQYQVGLQTHGAKVCDG
jgi:hypothetical protein